MLNHLRINFDNREIILKNLTNKQFDMTDCIVTDKKGKLIYKIVENSILKPDGFMSFEIVEASDDCNAGATDELKNYKAESDKGILYNPNRIIIGKYIK